MSYYRDNVSWFYIISCHKSVYQDIPDRLLHGVSMSACLIDAMTY